jgi:glycosyltransferase involved in cell wall biosynthesis
MPDSPEKPEPNHRPARVLITPVFNDRASVRVLMGKLADILGPSGWKICLVDDGSTLDPPQISDIAGAGFGGVILRLPHNMGHQAAIACGLGHVAATWPGADAVIIDADGEDRPEDLPGLLNSLAPQGLCAVVATRGRRSESTAFKCFYMVYKGLFGVLTGQRLNFGNFMVLSGDAVRRLASMQQVWLHVPAALIASRIPRISVSIDRGRRYAGASHMNFVSLSVHGLRALSVFPDAVFMRMIIAGTAIVATGFATLLVALLLKATGNATPGWFTTVSGIFLVTAIQAIGTFLTLLIVSGIVGRDRLRDASRLYLDCNPSVEVV